jgi:LDH2 family malate/lactate/ureidoglycolate dehydrogenase
MDVDIERVRLTVQEALDLGNAALRGAGMPADEAEIITNHLVDNMLCGYEFAGLPRIIAMVDHPSFRGPHTEVKIVHETPMSAMIDGGNHVGYASVLKGAEIAGDKALQSGMSIVGVNNCWFSGRNAYYLEHIARRGLVAIHTASGANMVVPPGARTALLGTNPIAFAIPTDGDPIVFDMGTAATMWGEVLLFAMLDKQFPEGIGVDSEGRATTSAKEMSKGGVLPFGGHKGYGLSVIVQALGVLAGAHRAAGKAVDNAFLFIAIDPALLMPRQEFYQQTSAMVAQLKALPLQPGVDEIRIPSERAYAERRRRKEEGLLLATKVRDVLRAMAGSQA